MAMAATLTEGQERMVYPRIGFGGHLGGNGRKVL